MKREIWIDRLRIFACFGVMPSRALVCCLVRRIPRVGKWIIG